jgi:hypothetical protein
MTSESSGRNPVSALRRGAAAAHSSACNLVTITRLSGTFLAFSLPSTVLDCVVRIGYWFPHLVLQNQ